MKKLVSIIIVSWNGKQFLKRCFSSLSKQHYSTIEIIFVDNASTDDSVEYIRSNYPKVRIIVNKKNVGFAEANNIGYRASRGEYVLFLNNDTEVTKNFLTELVRVLESDPVIGGVQSKILLMEKRQILDSVSAFLTHTGFLYHYGIGKKDGAKYSHQIEIYSPKGACMAFKREILENVKVRNELFDKQYFAYFEETDLAHRVWLAGYKIVFAPRSVIYHKGGATSSRLDNAFVQYHSFKNRINSYTKNLGIVNLCAILVPHIIVCELLSVAFLLMFKPKLFWAIQGAIMWNMQQLRATLSKRKIIQRQIRVKSDKEFFPTILRNINISYYWYLYHGLEDYEDVQTISS